MKIKISIGLFALAFVSSSYVNHKTTSKDEYSSIQDKVTNFNTSKSNTSNVESCAKCHDCKGQNYVTDTMQIFVKSDLKNIQENSKILKTEPTTSASLADKNIELDDYFYPDSFKISIKN